MVPDSLASDACDLLNATVCVLTNIPLEPRPPGGGGGGGRGARSEKQDVLHQFETCIL